MRMYPFQKAVERALSEGHNVILQAPTGSGKTLAALRPFLRAVNPDRPTPPDQFPRKCIYSVPMRVLANQFEDEYRRSLRRLGMQHEIPISIQTGEHPDDPRFEAALIFATIDQTLSSFLHVPYGLSQRQANLNAGAIISSYLVFDEFHLFGPDDMLPTTLAMLRMLRDTTPFILMTATFSRQMLRDLADWLDAVVIPDEEAGPEDDASREQMLALPPQQNKERVFHAHDAPLTAEAVLAHQGQRTLCVCNTVARAQALYQELKQALAGDDTRVTLLHSRFYRKDREAKEQVIRKVFGESVESYTGPPHILVATQVVEVGLDITSEMLHTELAPAATILQRAGRCARREGERGEVHVYLPRYPEGHEHAGEPDYAPYYLPGREKSMARGKKLCDATWEALQSGEFTGRHMDFELEQRFIDEVHTPVDREIMEWVRRNESKRLSDMLKTMESADYGRAPDLIRNTGDTRFVFIHSAPEREPELQRNPWHYEGFNLRPGTIYGAWKELEERSGDDDLGYVAWRPVPLSEEEREEYGQDAPRYTWQALHSPDELYHGTLALALNPQFAAYDPEVGLHFEVGPARTHTSPVARKRLRHFGGAYRRETYTEHIGGLLKAYEKETAIRDENGQHRFMARPLQDEIAYVQRRLSEQWNLPPDGLDHMARLIIALHDAGKLSKGWQKWAHAWHRKLAEVGLGEPLPEDYLAAHTDFNREDETQRELQKQVRPARPRHAGESAVASAGMIHRVSQGNEALARAGLSAIMRHHTPLLDDYTPYHIVPGGREALREAVELAGLADLWDENGLRWSLTKGGGFKGVAVRFDGQFYREVLLYDLLVRVLRLADQRSQQELPGG